jgi:hypothetical protein
MSFVPAETEAGVRREIAERVASVARASAWLREHPPTIEYFGWHAEPWIQGESDAGVGSIEPSLLYQIRALQFPL